MRTFYVLLAGFVVLALFVALERRSGAAADAPVTGGFGEPIPGLSPAEHQLFEVGRSVFTRRFGRQDGLGPHFNSVSCASCHEDPVPGGSSERYRDFFLVARNGLDGQEKPFPDCTAANRSTHRTKLCLPSGVVPHYGPKGTEDDPVSAEVAHPTIPDDADVVARRNAPPLFGLGLFLEVPDAEILSRADPQDADGDGISGRVNRISSENDAIGRFGYKSQTASIEAFNRGALINQMGITSDSTELVVGDASAAPGLLRRLFGPKVAHAQVAVPKDRITDFDDVFDPEIRRGDLLALIHFQKNLAAPRRGRITPAVQRGEVVFEESGCTGCHTPSLETPRGLIHPYTDLLLHDMGPELADGIRMSLAEGSEFRTQPLWGLCQHAPFLHDGRADTVSEAILLHGGEAAGARAAYAELDEVDHEDLHRFLESL